MRAVTLSSLRAVIALTLVSAGASTVAQAPADSSLSVDGPVALLVPSDTTGAALEDFLVAAVGHSPRLGIAREDLNIQAAREDAAFRQLLPQIAARASITENRRETLGTVDRFRGERYSLELNQVLFNWEAYGARRQARRLEVMRRAQYHHELSLMLTQVADRFLDVLQAQEALASIAAEMEAVASQVAQIERLYERQLAPITDLRRAQASLSAVRAEQAVLQGELELAREGLRGATGIPVGELHVLREEAAVPQPPNDIEEWVRVALEQNWELEAGRQSLSAAEAGVSRSKGTLMPSLSLVLLHQDSNVGFDNTPIQRTDISYVGLSATVPLFSGGTRWAGIREARSTRARTELELQQVELDVRGRVRGAYLQLRTDRARREAAVALLDATNTAVASVQRGFALGTVTNVEVLSAIRDRFRAERDLQQIRHDEIRHFLLLKHESGTLTSEDMAAVSDWFEKPGP